jgi:hypothetical protein
MKVRIFRQRVSQVYEGETEVNDWLEQVGDSVSIAFIEQSSYMTENSDSGTPGYIISVWYTES